jgi:hypothetical protein
MTDEDNKKVYGVGINDSLTSTIYDENGQRKRCPYYGRWFGLLSRCYSQKALSMKRTYEGVTVCNEWLIFSNFKAWMEKQDWEGKELDKDILVPGNKIYSPDTCVFVERRVNLFILEMVQRKSGLLQGVTKYQEKYRAQCNQLDGKKKSLGYFSTQEEAHEAWRKEKLRLARILAIELDDPRIGDALIYRYETYGVNYDL